MRRWEEEKTGSQVESEINLNNSDEVAADLASGGQGS
jgi:hypothetical protein